MIHNVIEFLLGASDAGDRPATGRARIRIKPDKKVYLELDDAELELGGSVTDAFNIDGGTPWSQPPAYLRVDGGVVS